MKPQTQPPTTITVRMGRGGPVAEPNTAKVPRGGKVQWVPEDDDRWWMVLMKADKKTPFSNKRKTFKGKGKGNPQGGSIKAGLKAGTEYGYWLIYEASDGEIMAKDPKIVIQDPDNP